MNEQLDEAEDILKRSITLLETRTAAKQMLGKQDAIGLKQSEQSWFNLGHLLHIRARKVLQENRKPLESKVKNLSWQKRTWENVGDFVEEYTSLLKESEISISRAIEINPENSKNWYVYGQVLDELGKYNDAVRALEQAIELDRKCKKCWFSKGLAEAHKDDIEAAELSFRQVLKYDKDFADAWWCLGATLQDLGRTAELEEVRSNLERLGLPRWTMDEIL